MKVFTCLVLHCCLTLFRQEAMICLEEDTSRLDVSRRYSAIYGRFDSKRPPNKQMNFHEVCHRLFADRVFYVANNSG